MGDLSDILAQEAQETATSQGGIADALAQEAQKKASGYAKANSAGAAIAGESKPIKAPKVSTPRRSPQRVATSKERVRAIDKALQLEAQVEAKRDESIIKEMSRRVSKTGGSITGIAGAAGDLASALVSRQGRIESKGLKEGAKPVATGLAGMGVNPAMSRRLVVDPLRAATVKLKSGVDKEDLSKEELQALEAAIAQERDIEETMSMAVYLRPKQVGVGVQVNAAMSASGMPPFMETVEEQSFGVATELRKAGWTSKEAQRLREWTEDGKLNVPLWEQRWGVSLKDERKKNPFFPYPNQRAFLADKRGTALQEYGDIIVDFRKAREQGKPELAALAQTKLSERLNQKDPEALDHLNRLLYGESEGMGNFDYFMSPATSLLRIAMYGLAGADEMTLDQIKELEETKILGGRGTWAQGVEAAGTIIDFGAAILASGGLSYAGGKLAQSATKGIAATGARLAAKQGFVGATGKWLEREGSKEVGRVLTKLGASVDDVLDRVALAQIPGNILLEVSRGGDWQAVLQSMNPFESGLTELERGLRGFNLLMVGMGARGIKRGVDEAVMRHRVEEFFPELKNHTKYLDSQALENVYDYAVKVADGEYERHDMSALKSGDLDQITALVAKMTGSELKMVDSLGRSGGEEMLAGYSEDGQGNRTIYQTARGMADAETTPHEAQHAVLSEAEIRSAEYRQEFSAEERNALTGLVERLGGRFKEYYTRRGERESLTTKIGKLFKKDGENLRKGKEEEFIKLSEELDRLERVADEETLRFLADLTTKPKGTMGKVWEFVQTLRKDPETLAMQKFQRWVEQSGLREKLNVVSLEAERLAGVVDANKITNQRFAYLAGKPDDVMRDDAAGGDQVQNDANDARDDNDPVVDLVHYSGTEGLTELDPDFIGTGLHPNNEDLRRAQDPSMVRGTHFYPAGSTVELRIGSRRRSGYVAQVKKSELYNAQEDPLGFFKDASSVEDAYRMARDAGFKGVSGSTRGEGEPNRVYMFGKTPVKEFKPGKFKMGDRAFAPKDAQALADSANAAGGFTYNIRTGELNPSKGWAVGNEKLSGKVMRVKKDALSAEDVQAWVDTHGDLDDGVWFGAWKDGEWILEASEVVDDFDAAMRLAAERGERAIFGFEKAEEVSVPYDSRGPEGRTIDEDAYRAMLEARQIKGSPGSKLFNDPNPETAEIEAAYKRAKGIDTPDGEKITRLDKENSKRIAAEYERMAHDPTNPEVAASYRAMAEETIDQFDFIVDAGYKFEIYEGEGEPYANSGEMIADVRDNRHMYILSTEKEFGSGITPKDLAENPLLADSGRKDVNGKRLLVNDVFRGVHDFFGHSKRGNGFGPLGEENAWDVHARMYSDLARRAMTTETRGQNSWVNFSGANDAANAKLAQAKEIEKAGGDASELRQQFRDEFRFADQKIGLMPEWTSRILGSPGSGEPLLKAYYSGAIELRSRPRTDQLRLLEDVALEIEMFSRERGLELDPLSPMFASAVHRAMSEEVTYQASLGKGLGFYTKDVFIADHNLRRIYPEMVDQPERLELFHLLASMASTGNTPVEDMMTGSRMYEAFNGKKVPPTDGNSRWTRQLHPSSVEVFNAVHAQNGRDLAKTVEWFRAPQPVEDIAAVRGESVATFLRKGVDAAYVVDGKAFGSFAIGPKTGSYFLNRRQMLDTVTKDRWVGRSIWRLVGTLLFESKSGETEVGPMPLFTNAESRAIRQAIDEAFKMTADQLGISPAEVQELWWAFEKDLYEHLGVGGSDGTLSDGARKIAQRKKVTFEEPDTTNIDADLAAKRQAVIERGPQHAVQELEEGGIDARRRAREVIGSPGRLTEYERELVDWAKPSHPDTKTATGYPRTFYHGTSADVGDLKIDYAGSRNTADPGMWGAGLYFSADPWVSVGYGSSLKRYHVRLENPLVVRSSKDWPEEINLPFDPSDEGRARRSRFVREKLIELGYDGVIQYDEGLPIRGAYQVVAFREDQVRRAVTSDAVARNDIGRRLKKAGFDEGYVRKVIIDSGLTPEQVDQSGVTEALDTYGAYVDVAPDGVADKIDEILGSSGSDPSTKSKLKRLLEMIFRTRAAQEEAQEPAPPPKEERPKGNADRAEKVVNLNLRARPGGDPRELTAEDRADETLGELMRLKDILSRSEKVGAKTPEDKRKRGWEEARRKARMLADMEDIAARFKAKVKGGEALTDIDIAAMDVMMSDLEAYLDKVETEIAVAESRSDHDSLSVLRKKRDVAMKMYEDIVGYGMEGISQAGRSLSAARMLARRSGGSAKAMVNRFESLARRKATAAEKAKIERAVQKRVQAEANAKKARDLEFEKAERTLRNLGKQLSGKKVTIKDLEAC